MDETQKLLLVSSIGKPHCCRNRIAGFASGPERVAVSMDHETMLALTGPVSQVVSNGLALLTILVTFHQMGKQTRASLHQVDILRKQTEASLRQLEVLNEQVAIQQSSGRASMLLEISEKWNAVYEIRNSVLLMDLDIEKLKAKYPDVVGFLGTEDWKKIREVANFYNYCGLLVDRKYIEAEVIFVLVTLDARICDKLVPIVEWLRDQYRPDIYEFFLALRKLKLGAPEKGVHGLNPLKPDPKVFGDVI